MNDLNGMILLMGPGSRPFWFWAWWIVRIQPDFWSIHVANPGINPQIITFYGFYQFLSTIPVLGRSTALGLPHHEYPTKNPTTKDLSIPFKSPLNLIEASWNLIETPWNPYEMLKWNLPKPRSKSPFLRAWIQAVPAMKVGLLVALTTHHRSFADGFLCATPMDGWFLMETPHLELGWWLGGSPMTQETSISQSKLDN